MCISTMRLVCEAEDVTPIVYVRVGSTIKGLSTADGTVQWTTTASADSRGFLLHPQDGIISSNLILQTDGSPYTGPRSHFYSLTGGTANGAETIAVANGDYVWRLNRFLSVNTIYKYNLTTGALVGSKWLGTGGLVNTEAYCVNYRDGEVYVGGSTYTAGVSLRRKLWVLDADTLDIMRSAEIDTGGTTGIPASQRAYQSVIPSGQYVFCVCSGAGYFSTVGGDGSYGQGSFVEVLADSDLSVVTGIASISPAGESAGWVLRASAADEVAATQFDTGTITQNSSAVWLKTLDSGLSVGWSKTLTGPTYTWQGSSGLSVDSGGNIYVGYASAANSIYVVRKYDPSGTLLWTSPSLSGITWGLKVFA